MSTTTLQSLSAILILLLLVSSAHSLDKTRTTHPYENLIGQLTVKAGSNQLKANLASRFIDDSLSSSSILGEPISSNDSKCIGCKAFFELIEGADQSLLKIVESFLVDVATQVCIKQYGYNTAVCTNLSQQMIPFIVESIQEHFFDPDYACPLIKVCPQVYEAIDIDTLIADILADKPNNVAKKTDSQSDSVQISKKILHLTDVHVDLSYLADTPTTCNYPICCRNNTSSNETDTSFYSQQVSAQLSGYWGSFGSCDLPVRTFDEFISFVEDNLADEIDLILWTGDNSSHDEENSSLSRNFNITQILSQKMQERLNVTVIGSMGNNDSGPDYIYDFQGNLDTNLQSQTAELWKQWIDDEQAYTMLKSRGYYATRVKALQNLKVISLNTFACTEKNYVLLRNSTDPGEQLQWLRAELADSEANSESVYIIGHIPIAFCSETWGRVYQAISERFQNTIQGQFFGHTHSDQFILLSSATNSTTTIGAQLITPSLTPNGARNPSFRVYEIDASSYSIIDYQQYRLNLQTVNNQGEAASPLNWDVAYEFRSTYNLTDVSINSLATLAENLSSKNEIYDILNMNYQTQYSPPSGYSKSLFCTTTAALVEEIAACQGTDPYPSTVTKVVHGIEKTWTNKIPK